MVGFARGGVFYYPVDRQGFELLLMVGVAHAVVAAWEDDEFFGFADGCMDLMGVFHRDGFIVLAVGDEDVFDAVELGANVECKRIG